MTFTGGTWLNWIVNDPSKVVVDPNSNWVGVKTGADTLALGCNPGTGDCGHDAFSSFVGDRMIQTVYVSARPDTNGLPYMTPTPIVPPSVSAYVNPYAITWRPVKLAPWERPLISVGCLNNSALPANAGSQAASDTPEGHMNGQRNARTANGTLLNPTGSESTTPDAVAGGAGAIGPTLGCSSNFR